MTIDEMKTHGPWLVMLRVGGHTKPTICRLWGEVIEHRERAERMFAQTETELYIAPLSVVMASMDLLESCKEAMERYHQGPFPVGIGGRMQAAIEKAT